MPESEITVTLPVDTRFVALTRVMAASLGAELHLSIDDIDGLALAVDELASLVILESEAVGGETFTLCYRLGEDGLDIEATVDHDIDFRVGIDGLTLQILDAAVDGYQLGTGRASISIRGSAA